VYFNNRITEYAGMQKTGDGSWNWVGMMHPDELNATLEEWKKTFATGSLFVREYRFQMAGGKYRWHLTRVTPYKDEHGNITKWIGTATDIDDMKSLVMQKEDFLSVASHELRTPITSIKAYSQLLSHTYRQSNDEFLINALSKLEGQANRMTKLVTDFLKLSKIESGKLQLHKERFLINDLVKEIAADIQFVSLNHKIIIEAPEKANVIGDRERIAQVVTNLLNNAVKYSPGAELVKISIVPNKTHVKVSVTDKGVGIKPEDHSRIFDRFYRASSAVKLPFSGFGIGLYISAEIIRKHGGEIGVISEEGKGSTFYFTLPQAE
jgi:PAS domain S-box-containing protein